jgi:ATP synthase protein I
MDEKPHDQGRNRKEIRRRFIRQVTRKEALRMKSINDPDRSVWFGLGMFGVVGWSVVVPTLIGTALGIWIDSTWPSSFSWTLMLLIGGVMLGCLNAWYWVRKGGIRR